MGRYLIHTCIHTHPHAHTHTHTHTHTHIHIYIGTLYLGVLNQELMYDKLLRCCHLFNSRYKCLYHWQLENSVSSSSRTIIIIFIGIYSIPNHPTSQTTCYITHTLYVLYGNGVWSHLLTPHNPSKNTYVVCHRPKRVWFTFPIVPDLFISFTLSHTFYYFPC